MALNLKKVHAQQVWVQATRREVDAGPNGTAVRWVPDGLKGAMVELWIDLDALLDELGDKAIRNRAKKSSLAHGLIQAHVAGSITRNREG